MILEIISQKIPYSRKIVDQSFRYMSEELGNLTGTI